MLDKVMAKHNCEKCWVVLTEFPKTSMTQDKIKKKVFDCVNVKTYGQFYEAVPFLVNTHDYHKITFESKFLSQSIVRHNTLGKWMNLKNSYWMKERAKTQINRAFKTCVKVITQVHFKRKQL